MNGQGRFIKLAGKRLVKVLIIFGLDFGFRLGPEGCAIGDALGLLASLLNKVNRHRNGIGMLGDDTAQPVTLCKFMAVRIQMQNDTGAVRGSLLRCQRGDLIGAFAVRGPAKRLRAASLAGFHHHVFGHHEGRIKANAKLADQIKAGFFTCAGFQLFQKIFGAGAGNGAQGADQISLVHADAIVGNGQAVIGLIGGDGDGKAVRLAQQGRILHGVIAQLLAGIRCIGNEFAQENIALGINRMHHQMQKFGHVGCESLRFDSRIQCFAHCSGPLNGDSHIRLRSTFFKGCCAGQKRGRRTCVRPALYCLVLCARDKQTVGWGAIPARPIDHCAQAMELFIVALNGKVKARSRQNQDFLS